MKKRIGPRTAGILRAGSVMALAGLSMQGIGVFFNAFLTGALGEAGMGLLSLTMSVYGFAVTFATSGVTLTITRLLAENLGRQDFAGARRCIRSALLYALLFGGAAAVLLYTLSDPVARVLLGDVRTAPSLRLLSLGLLPIALSSVLSGYFTACRRPLHNAATQMVEMGLRMVLTAGGLRLLLPLGLEYACLAVVGGSLLAEVFSCLALFLQYLPDRRLHPLPPPDYPSKRGRFGEFSSVALPTAATAWCRSGLSTAKHLLIPFCLGLGQASREGALASYAVLHGMALPVILFPAAPLASFAALLVPEVARSAAAGKPQEVEKAATTALSGTLYLSFAAATVLFLLAHPLSYTLYGSAQAGRYIRMLAPLIPIMYMDSATDAILKGLGKQVYCMVVNIGDAALCILFVLLLLPPFGADGYIAVICITEIYNFLFSFGKLTKLVRLPGRLWARSVFCLLWSILCALLTGALFGSPFSVGGMVLSGIFAVMVFGLGVFLFEEICMAAGLHFSRRCGKIKA